MLRPLFRLAARSPLVARLVLGVRPVKLGKDEHYFDATTLALLREVKARLPKGGLLLDMGTGSACAIGLGIWKTGRLVVSCDVNPEVAERARESIAAAGAHVAVVVSDLFENVEGQFDLVAFNPPYVRSADGESRSLPESTRSQWDGGESGTDVIERFLVAFEEWGGAPSALLGVNRRHVPREKVEACIARTNLKLEEVVSRAASDVYVLAR